jgi:hypothetical protein
VSPDGVSADAAEAATPDRTIVRSPAGRRLSRLQTSERPFAPASRIVWTRADTAGLGGRHARRRGPVSRHDAAGRTGYPDEPGNRREAGRAVDTGPDRPRATAAGVDLQALRRRSDAPVARSSRSAWPRPRQKSHTLTTTLTPGSAPSARYRCCRLARRTQITRRSLPGDVVDRHQQFHVPRGEQCAVGGAEISCARRRGCSSGRTQRPPGSERRWRSADRTR